jgi:hypothetical protein
MDSTNSFIKCLAMMAASLAGIDMPELKANFQTSLQQAEPFLRTHKLHRVFATHAKQFMKQRMELDDAAGAALNVDIKPFMPSLLNDVSISQEQLALLKDCLLYMRKDSEPAFKRITANVSLLKDSALSKLFLKPIAGADSAEQAIGDLKTQKGMEAIVFKLLGIKGEPILTLNEMKDLREEEPELIAKYSELRKVFAANYKANLLKFVRMSGKETVDVKVAAKYLKALGCNYIPPGFVGSINEKGVLFTTAGKQIAGMLIGEVGMNPKYDPKTDNTYVCYLVTNPTQQLRTMEFISGNKRKTFDKVNKFMDEAEQHRKKWVADVDSLDTKIATIAAMVEAIYQTQARIGGTSTNADNEDRYGMSTVLVKHLKIDSKGLDVSYVGKKGTMQHHYLKANSTLNRKIIAIIKNCVKGKKPDDLVFTYRSVAANGTATIKRLDGTVVNKYLKSIGVGLSIHKFRHIAGTKLALEILKTSHFKRGDSATTQAGVEAWLKQAFLPIGVMLHHRSGSGEKQKDTSGTAIASYVDPTVMKDFFTDLGLRVPKWVPKA